MIGKLILICLFWMASGCLDAGDLGRECALVKGNPDGGRLAVELREGELPLTRADYLSFGSPQCLDACARDSEQQRTGDNAAPVAGYCSHACTTDADCGSGYGCRSLLLDEAPLKSLCESDPSKCRSFAGNPQPFYCVRGST
jgi:hypothetical protein